MGYGDIIAIYHQAAEEAAQDRDTPPDECPNDGTTLMEDENGVLTCKWDGWQYLGYNYS